MLLPGRIEERENGIRPGYRRHLRAGHHPAGQLSARNLCDQSRRLEMAGPRICPARPELPEPHHVYRHHRLDGAAGRDVCREILAFALRFAGYLPAAYRRELRHLGWLALHAAAQLPLGNERHRLRHRLGIGLVACYRLPGGHSREAQLLQHTGTVAGHRHHVHHHRPDGYCLHELFRNQT